ncbi:Zinc finger protein klf1 [Colletotrichum spinosum]|uniref:Zinc finger protein klf1 n=1 Tax=Colletotrichum spinosum TaxID=1347390 RepID=A0A4R8Q2F6_9PEZI|nr:Zinc finger protein klf1 [Colletotrichum spinosum]
MPFTCDYDGCGRSYLRKEHLTRHKKEHMAVASFSCPTCGTKFTRGDTLRRHMVLHGPTAPPTRVAQACVQCHRTKTRCDGRQPTCTTCHDKGRCCEWPNPRDKRVSAERSSRSPSSGLDVLATCASASALPDAVTCPLTPAAVFADLMVPLELDILARPMTTYDFAPGSTLDEGLRMELQSVYFTRFHPQWPLLHREYFQSTLQPKLLMQAVVTVGLWFASAPGMKSLAVKFHDHLMIEIGNKILELLEQSRQGLLCPRMDLLPIFQAMLISTILVPYRADKSMDNVMMTHAMMLETFKASGIYEQSRIDEASQAYGHNAYPRIFRESYQRLAVFQFRLHLILQAIFITIHPALRISRNAEPYMLKVKVPLPQLMWDGPAENWCDLFPTDPALLDPDASDAPTISNMCSEATLLMDSKPLLPLFSWDRCLGMALWCWCMKHSSSDREFIENIKPFVLQPLEGAGFGYV